MITKNGLQWSIRMSKIYIYCDGACRGNQHRKNVGGWGVYIQYKNHTKELSGRTINTTNNIMEMTAVIEALKALKRPCEVEIYSDSSYVVNTFEKGWIYNWQKNNWKTASKDPVKNQELWEELLRIGGNT